MLDVKVPEAPAAAVLCQIFRKHIARSQLTMKYPFPSSLEFHRPGPYGILRGNDPQGIRYVPE